MSFLDDFFPVTCRFEFARLPFATAMTHARAVFHEARYRFRPLPPASLIDRLPSLLPIIKPTPNRILILETRSDWTAFLGNGVTGISGFYLRNQVARTETCETASFTMSTKPKIPSFQFEWTPRGPFDAPGRHIAAHVESRWEWHASGTPLPFEETDAYTARLKRDRLTPERLIRYARALGIMLDDPEFYAGEAVLFEKDSTPNESIYCEAFGKEAFAAAGRQ